MTNLCNHTSVGVLARRDGSLLLFQRQKFPITKAPCAGHVDELRGIPTGARRGEEAAYRKAGARELQEETGLTVRPEDLRLLLTSEKVPNECRRATADGGPPWHLWRVYEADIPQGQEARGNPAESADLAWYTPREIDALPDLEPVWRGFLQDLRII